MDCKKNEANEQAAKNEMEKLAKTNETFIEDIKRLTNELDFERKQIIDLGSLQNNCDYEIHLVTSTTFNIQIQSLKDDLFN